VVIVLYQYKGAVTVGRESEFENQVEQLRQDEQRAWDMAQAAEAEVQRVEAENKKLRDTLADLRRHKKNLQKRIRRMHAAAAAPKPPKPKPVLTSFGGREGLAAAAKEARDHERRKRLALAA
jgi:hypothetical protein